jgi:hypothetical protein
MKIRLRFNSLLPKLLKVDGLTLYPFVLIRDSVEKTPISLIRHEFIHVFQIERVGFIRFYISYALFYLASRVSGSSHKKAYLEIPYEKEAYLNQDDPDSAVISPKMERK